MGKRERKLWARRGKGSDEPQVQLYMQFMVGLSINTGRNLVASRTFFNQEELRDFVGISAGVSSTSCS